MKVEYIICENKAERDAVFRKLEKNGYIWANGRSLTEWTAEDTWKDEPIILNLDKEQMVRWAFARTDYREHPHAVSAQHYLYKHRPILITRKGRVVTAENKNTGEKAIATCSPDDTFDFGTGAMIAVARLMAKTPEAITDDVKAEWEKVLGIEEVKVYTDDDRNFKVGDRVVVRDWGDMAKEYGAEDNDIHPDECTTSFTSKMKHLCGRTATITDVDDDYVRVEFDDKSGDIDWYFRRWMFNPSDSDRPTTKFKVGDLVTLKDGLESGSVYDGITLLSNMYRNGNCKPLKVVDVDSNEHYSCVPTDESIDIAVSYWYSEEMLEPWDENKIREGDIVRVINTGKAFDTYFEWVARNVEEKNLIARFKCDSLPPIVNNYEVVKIAPHGACSELLAYIKSTATNRCYVVGVGGLEKVTE